jgi:aconitate hydratase
MDKDITTEPLGSGSDGQPVYLKDVWPSPEEVAAAVAGCVDSAMFKKSYSSVFAGDAAWNAIAVAEGNSYAWDDKSTYVRNPPYFDGMTMTPKAVAEIQGARALAVLGDSVTTDHISPAGAIKASSPAGRYLQAQGVPVSEFNSYGSRRGNDRVMTRGTFANVRIKNLMVPGFEGGVTVHQPSGQQLDIYDACMQYQSEGVGLMVFAGHEYGTGSSRDWAAKGTSLLGVKAVVAQSFERIHRSNLVGMGVLPLQFKDGESAQTLGITGTESYDLVGIAGGITPRMDVTLRINRADGTTSEHALTLRIDTPIEVEYYLHGGILPYVLRQLVAKA